MSQYARYFTRVHAENRHAGYGVSTEVVATNKADAVARAIELAWGDSQRQYARVTIDKIVDEPIICTHSEG